MNPSNPFGSPQSGAFQAPSNAMKTGLFPSFGQQSSGNQPQSVGFFPPTAFGQPPVLSQSSTHGSTIFGQPSTQPPSLATINQAPAFGQPSLGMSVTGFGNSSAAAFGQTGEPNQSSGFGPTPSFAQPSAFGQAPPGYSQQAPGFVKQPPGFGQQPPRFGTSQMTSVPTTASGQPQPLSFGQSVFGQSSSTSGPTSAFGTAPSVTQSRGFAASNYSFKPSNEAVFKPIFNASPEPANPQTTSMSSSPFGTSGSQTNSGIMSSSGTTATGFSGTKSGHLGFSFSQPAAAPSVSAQTNSLTTVNSGTPSNPLQFTFSQPAALSSSGTTGSTTEPTTPSTFNFSASALQPQARNPFGPPPAYGETKAKAETGTEEKGSTPVGLGGISVFARLGKGTKRKEEPLVHSAVPEKPATGVEENVPEEGDAPRHASKRPLMRARCPPPGLFGRALSGLRREATKEIDPQATKWEEPESEDVQDQEHGDVPPTPPTVQALTREGLEKAEQSDSAQDSVSNLGITTSLRRRQSSESLSGMSAADCTIIQCRNVPQSLNRKDVIEKHFGRFGKLRKVLCRPTKNLVIVHFDDHASAAKAKKKGKHLHKQELFLSWQKKKQSPEDKGSRPATGKEEAEGESQEDTESTSVSSPLRKPALRGPAISSLMAFSRSSPVKKSSIAKSLQFDTEPQRESRTDAQTSERPVPSSLLHLIGQMAETAEDKFRLLEQRDKILRQGRPKRTDLDLSKVFVGTCPDMCPEKERYMRETRKQLSVFEVIPDTEMVDHSAAIKEYSRSSADQEEPLPHELRPLPVLGMTMDYLVTQIMDQGHDNYRDWYDLVWNRTRAIRKDITQQHLCCPHTVSLIEKCTRFHVHCAHHLCEERLSAFDAKINNENMTKCLQSLKEMYQDLAMRHIYCPMEAEFRQYNVLLKLNDGDILREVEQFRDEVRNSPEVKLAVQAFTAVNSNNFVRFFKLVKGASYLASCLLHRYFNQVRAKALSILNTAYTVGPRSTAFPVEDIVRMLMFRTAEEASDFIQQYGLNINDGVVELSRVAHQEPDLLLSQKRSEVILAKRTMLFGEVVNGGPLPSPVHHRPVCSFDSQNRYRGEGPLAESTHSQFKAFAAKAEVKVPAGVELLTQVVPHMHAGFGLPPPAAADETGEPRDPYGGSARPADAQQLFQPIPQPQPARPPSPPPKPQPVYSNEDIMAELDCVIEEVVGAAVREVAAAGASYAATALTESSVQVESLVSEVLGQMLEEISSTEIKLERERVADEKSKLEEARRRQEHEVFLLQFNFSLCRELIDEVLDETIKETATSEIQQAEKEKANCVAKCTEQVCTSLVEETLNEDIALLVEELLEAELQCIHKYIKRWRDVVAVRRQLKRQMRGFPAAPCCVDPRFKLQALAPSAPAQPSMADLARGLVNLGNAGALAFSSTRSLKMREEAIHQMRVHYYYQQLLDERVWEPLDLPTLVTENIPNPPDRIFWKAVLLLPSDHESVASLADRILSDWLEVKLGGSKESEEREEQRDGTLQTLCVTNTLRDEGQRTYRVHVSVKASRGPLTDDGLSKTEECGELQGTGGLIVLLPAVPTIEPGPDEQDVPLLSALLQLKQLQQASAWHCPLPLAILVPGPECGTGDTQKLEEALMLHTLVQEGLISEYTFFFIPETTSDLQGSRQLSQATRWLLARAPPPIPLSCQTLVQLVEATLSREFSPRVYAHRQDRVNARLSTQGPVPVIQLYNAIVAHIADKASSQDLSKLSWPPGEFCFHDNRDIVPHLGWNSAKHLDWLQEVILSLQLPQWEQPSATDSWSALCSFIFRYAAQIPVSQCSQPVLMSQLENLLQRVKLRGHHTRTPASKVARTIWDDEDACPSSRIPWDDVLVICIDHKLKDWLIPGPPVCEDALTDDGEILVYVLTESLNSFQPPEEWAEALRKTHREKQQETEGADAAACATPSSLVLRQRLFTSLVEPVEAPTAPLDITHTPTAQELLAHNLLNSLEEEKSESKRCMEQLQRWLDGEPVAHLSTPLFIPSSTLLLRGTTIMHAAATAPVPQPEPDDLSDKADRPQNMHVSMAWRLKELQRQISASREEELACTLKLSSLLSIVDD
ncbi:germinal-center associated nuclear protein isoform X2 [Clinocottus analis]|uniref:germinal-center associated nuclear protein isoform X2 n=1 Tax=Clinocottus analis TaxID=304258 RepID=UPI0035C00AF6